ncbi:MAG TPA: hypothetical protein VLN57_21195 [Xanthobacteraceae bacterium]|nr:hypothetical protein [Xanthobacteraceae bacterium]
MAAGLFVIQESGASGDPADAGDVGVRFEWTADSTPTRPFTGNSGGGARACPVKPWAQPREQRIVKTNYPNAVKPSVQVMGPVLGQQTFTGRWDDRYNGPGYAKFEQFRMEELIGRGRIVRISYDEFAFDGIIVNLVPTVQRAWDIDYSITFEALSVPADRDTLAVPITPDSPLTSLNAHDLAVQATLDADGVAPRNAVAGTLANDITEQLVAMTSARDELGSSIDLINLSLPTAPINSFTRIASQFNAAKAAAFNLLLLTAEVRADLDMAHQTAISTLDFEDWIRSLRFDGRLAMQTAADGAANATEHAEPSAVRRYRPSAGEHLYAISRRFYNTPHAWHLIYERNSLRTFVMSGAEILFIPERGGT